MPVVTVDSRPRFGARRSGSGGARAAAMLSGLGDFTTSALSLITNAIYDVEDTIANAATGHLTQDQVQAIKNQTASDILQAAGGDQTVAAAAIAQANTEIDATLQDNNAAPLGLINSISATLFGSGGSTGYWPVLLIGGIGVLVIFPEVLDVLARGKRRR